MASPLQKAYQLTITTSENAWNLVQMWNIFSRTIIGNNFVTGLDNLTICLAKAAKLQEQPDKKRCLIQAKEHLIECMIWNDKARRRKLLSNQEYQLLYVRLSKIEEILNKISI